MSNEVKFEMLSSGVAYDAHNRKVVNICQKHL